MRAKNIVIEHIYDDYISKLLYFYIVYGQLKIANI